MIRKSLFIQAGIQFDPDFGLGAPFGVGEDYIFIADALSRKLNCITVPVVTGSHPHQSTGDNWSSKELLQARKAVIRRVFGFWAPFVRVAYAIRHRAKFDAVSSIFSFVF